MKKIAALTFFTLITTAIVITFLNRTNSTKTTHVKPSTSTPIVITSTPPKQIEAVLEKHRENVRLAENNWQPVSPFNQ